MLFVNFHLERQGLLDCALRDRKLLLFFLSLCLIICNGCDDQYEQLQEKIRKYSESGINKDEYTDLVNTINKDRSRFKTFYVNGLIAHEKFRQYISSYCKSARIPIAEGEIYNPTKQNQRKIAVNVFLENSASMDGYLNGISSFKSNIFKLLTDFKTSSITGPLNLNFINSKPISIKVDADHNDIEDFHVRLNPSDFRKKGGNRTNSDIQRMFNEILARTDNTNLNVFVSDCVFSPGPNVNATDYLDDQRSAIYNEVMAAKSRLPNLSILLLQCTSQFTGSYYDRFNRVHYLDAKDRPYYIWFFGTAQQIQQLSSEKFLELLDSPPRNRIVFQTSQSPFKPEFRVLYTPRIGEFRVENATTGPIVDARASKNGNNKGIFGFKIAVNYSKSLQDTSYFSQPKNYEISRGYNYTVTPSLRPSFTHELFITTKNLHDDLLKIEVLGQMPTWVGIANSVDDVGIATDRTEQMKTFGIRNLVQGVSDAFYPKSQKNIISSFTIEIRN